MNLPRLCASSAKVLALVCLVASLRGTGFCQTAPARWNVGLHHDRAGVDGPQRVEISAVSAIDPLVCSLSIELDSPEKGQPPDDVVINGHIGTDRSFWADAELQISDDGDSWETIKRFDGAGETKVRVYTAMTVFGVLVELQPFKQYFGKRKLGRIVLSSGALTEFTLEALAEWSKEKHAAP